MRLSRGTNYKLRRVGGRGSEGWGREVREGKLEEVEVKEEEDREREEANGEVRGGKE